MTAKPKRQRWTPGAVVAIDLGDGEYCFGVLLEFPSIAFWDIYSTEPIPPQTPDESQIMFKLAIMRSAISRGVWPKVGVVELGSFDLSDPVVFNQDFVDGSFFLVHSSFPGADNRIPATYEEVIGLECEAVWEVFHVVERINCHRKGEIDTNTKSLLPIPPTQ